MTTSTPTRAAQPLTTRAFEPADWYCRAATAVAAPADEPSRDPPLNQVLPGDALSRLRLLPDQSIDCVVTSPPYHLLRNYDAGPDELGTETHVDEYVDRLVKVCDEIARVLTPHGGLWLNLGDSFSRGPRYGAPAKSQLLAPERVALRLIERGWVLRNKIVWAKRNAMPASVDDRLNTKWEPLFFFVRSKRYFYDLDAIREPHETTRHPRPFNHSAKYLGPRAPWSGPLAGKNDGLERARAEGRAGHPLGKNPGDVWTIGTTSYRGSHFAVFPKGLAHKPIIVGCPERVCRGCGRPWQRERRRDRLGEMKPSCRGCNAGWRPGRVLDPFLGSGTVAVVAEDLGRDWLGIELNPAFVAMANARVEAARRQGGRR